MKSKQKALGRTGQCDSFGLQWTKRQRDRLKDGDPTGAGKHVLRRFALEKIAGLNDARARQKNVANTP